MALTSKVFSVLPSTPSPSVVAEEVLSALRFEVGQLLFGIKDALLVWQNGLTDFFSIN